MCVDAMHIAGRAHRFAMGVDVIYIAGGAHGFAV